MVYILSNMWYNNTYREENMNYIDVNGCSPRRYNLVHEAAAWCVNRIMPRMRTLDIDIEMMPSNKMDDSEGLCWSIDKRHFMIQIKKGMNRDDLLTTIFHEIVHVKQHARGEYVSSDYKTHKQYMAQPCEKEAYIMQEILLKEWKEYQDGLGVPSTI